MFVCSAHVCTSTYCISIIIIKLTTKHMSTYRERIIDYQIESVLVSGKMITASVHSVRMYVILHQLSLVCFSVHAVLLTI